MKNKDIVKNLTSIVLTIRSYDFDCQPVRGRGLGSHQIFCNSLLCGVQVVVRIVLIGLDRKRFRISPPWALLEAWQNQWSQIREDNFIVPWLVQTTYASGKGGKFFKGLRFLAVFRQQEDILLSKWHTINNTIQVFLNRWYWAVTPPGECTCQATFKTHVCW